MPVVQSSEDDKQPEQVETDATLNTHANPEIETSDPKSNGSANNSFENMESLLVNEDEDDDPIGTESLLMSGSEGEEGERISPVRRKKRAPKIIDSEDEDGAKQDENTNEKPPDDEEDRGGGDTEPVDKAFKPKKFSALIDSDSEPEATPEENKQKDSIDSDIVSEGSREGKKQNKTKNLKKVKKAKKKPRSPKMDSDSEDETDKLSKPKKKSNISNLVDSDSEPSVPSDEESGQDTHSQEQNEADASTQRPKKQQRASAKKAMDEMQAIQSETQRLYRETQVSIPYHKPKRHTLKEFLTRHTIAKPQIGEGGSGKRLKMTPEELEAYAKHLEERAKEATEFFKSESEDELEDVAQADQENKNLESVAIATPVVEAMDFEEHSEATRPSKDDIDNLVDSGVTSLPTTQDLIDLELPQESEILPEPIASTSTAPVNRETQPISSRLSDLKRRLIAEKNLPAAPTLKGGPNMIIDFESGDIVPSKPTGLESLFQRFVKSNVNNKKPKETVLMTESGLDKPKINVCVIEEANKEKEPKPGAAYVKLKESLRTLITKKRKEEFQKKIEETQEEELEYKKCCGLDDDDDDEDEDEGAKERESRQKKVEKDIVIDDEENEIELLNDEEDEEEEDDDVEEPCEIDEGVMGTEATNGNEENGDGNDKEDADEIGEDEDEEDDSDSDEEQANDDPLTRKHRVIKAFEDSDDEKDDLGTDLNATATSVLFAEEEEKNPEEVENELLGLCSGQFEESQRLPIISQIPITQTPGVAEDTELMNLCSGGFNEESSQIVKEVPKEKQKTLMKILSSDEEEKEPEEEKESTDDSKKVKKLRKKQKKRAKLGFSDDEDEEVEEEQEQDLQDSYEEEEDEIPQTFIDYDSEENEIEVQMSKKECQKQANAFLEKEAELSESEWGSADEDEQNLDKYDIELGDEDEFDREKIRAELGQIHMRKVLDDDIREVKKIQEMLFDDEEADGVGRQRQFRWKNIENGFSLDGAAGGDPDNDDGIDSADDEEEMKWRKMRFEREQLLKQKTKEEILAEVSATALGRSLLSTMEPDIETNMVYEPEVLVEKEYKAPSFLIAQCDVKSMRGSFLNYDKETLALIAAAATKSGVPNEDEQMQHKASKTGNFVFAPLSEEEQALRKRKAEKVQSAGSGNAAKKMKPGKSLLLDKLL